MVEKIDIQSNPEHRPEEISVQISYELTDSYGGNAVKGESATFDIGEVPPKAEIFDGYIHTTEGDFAFQGPIAQVQKVLKDIEEYCRCTREKKEVEAALKQAYEAREWAGDRYRSHGEEEPLKKAMRKVSDLSRKKSLVELSFHDAAEKVAAYR